MSFLGYFPLIYFTGLYTNRTLILHFLKYLKLGKRFGISKTDLYPWQFRLRLYGSGVVCSLRGLVATSCGAFLVFCHVHYLIVITMLGKRDLVVLPFLSFVACVLSAMVCLLTLLVSWVGYDLILWLFLNIFNTIFFSLFNTNCLLRNILYKI